MLLRQLHAPAEQHRSRRYPLRPLHPAAHALPPPWVWACSPPAASPTGAHVQGDEALYYSVLWIQLHWIWIRILNCVPIKNYFINFEEKKNSFGGNWNYMKTVALEEKILVWVSEWWIFVSNLTPFASYLSYFYLCGSVSGSVLRIRIQFESGSTTQEWFVGLKVLFIYHSWFFIDLFC